jgi:hypothetical protein
LAALPGLALEGLSDADARATLASVIPGRLDERIRDRIIAESGGNPLALLELPRGVTAAELAGGFGMADPQPVAGRIEQSYRWRITPLPETTQRLLLLAAAEPTGDPALLWRAARNLGIRADAATPAEADRLLTVADRVFFRHPLVRSAVYRAASVADRHRAHGAIAEATDPRTDPDRRAWHRAQSTSVPDEDIASELERSASRAQARGGFAAAAAFLERSAALTLDPAQRAARAFTAAQAKAQAGPDRPAGRRRPVQPSDRRPAVHADAPSNTTCTRSSPSSPSAPATRSTAPWPTAMPLGSPGPEAGGPARDPTDANALVPGAGCWHGA